MVSELSSKLLLSKISLESNLCFSSNPFTGAFHRTLRGVINES